MWNEPKREKMYLLTYAPTKTQISLRIRAVWLESSLYAWRNFVSLAIQIALSEDSNQTALVRKLIWIFTWRTYMSGDTILDDAALINVNCALLGSVYSSREDVCFYQSVYKLILFLYTQQNNLRFPFD